MRPFQEFRFWTRRAPTADRITAGVGALLCVVLLAWLLVPGSGPKPTNLAATGVDEGGALYHLGEKARRGLRRLH